MESQFPVVGEKVEPGSLHSPGGHKQRQRRLMEVQCPCCHETFTVEDREDRNRPFSNALFRHDIAATDIDWLLTTRFNGFVVMIEYTECPSNVCQAYLTTIDERRQRQHNDSILLVAAERIGVRAVLVAADRSIEHNDQGVVHWRWMDESEWHHPDALTFFRSLKAYQAKHNIRDG